MDGRSNFGNRLLRFAGLYHTNLATYEMWSRSGRSRSSVRPPRTRSPHAPAPLSPPAQWLGGAQALAPVWCALHSSEESRARAGMGLAGSKPNVAKQSQFCAKHFESRFYEYYCRLPSLISIRKEAHNLDSGEGILSARATARFLVHCGLALAQAGKPGGPGFFPPSNKITLAYVGCGTQGLSEMLGMLAMPEVQIVAVCDPVKDGNFYVSWSKDSLRVAIGKTLGKPDWRKGEQGISGGRDVAKEVIETCYANQRVSDKFKGISTYVDFRELLEKEKDVDPVKVMTPDHLHATVALAAMKRGKHVLMHKPIANRLREARLVVDMARTTKLTTHFLPASDGGQFRAIKAMVDDGVIGTLRELHDWTNRPVWPQYPVIPTDRPPVPEGFDWQLWLGPSLDRPYHPNYTFAVFRGWYEFGGGAMADMGHYSLWPVFRELDLDSPFSVESTPSVLCSVNDSVSRPIKNDYSFPVASTVRLRFAAKGNRPPPDIFWYDGSIRPPRPLLAGPP